MEKLFIKSSKSVEEENYNRLANAINELISENEKLREAVRYLALFDGKFTDRINGILK